MSPARVPLRRWVATMTVALVLAVGCAGAGVWQWNRHVARSTAVALIQTNYDAAPVPLDRVLDPGAARLPAGAVWQPVTVHGHYLPDASVLLRNRPVGGQPSFHVLEPFAITEGELAGSVLVVDRGWVPTGTDSSAAAEVPDPPAGSVQLVVRLRPDEPPAQREAPPGQVQAISVEQVRDASAKIAWPEVLPAYGMAVSEDGAAPDGLGRLRAPGTSLGSHLSYAFQWWVFALGALVGGVVLLVREGRDGEPDRAPQRPTSSRRRRPTAEQEEDALIEAQLRR